MIAQSRELADDREKLVKKMDSHIDKEKKRKEFLLCLNTYRLNTIYQSKVERLEL